MSDFEEKKPAQTPEDWKDLSLDELIRDARAEIDRADALMAERPAEEKRADAPSDDAPFAPTLPVEYAALHADSETQEQPAAAPEEPQKKHRIPAVLRVLLYVFVILAASVLIAGFAWKCAGDVLALRKPDRSVNVTIEENSTIADVAKTLHDSGLIDYEWLFKFYCWFSHAENKIDPGTYQLNNLYDYHALVNGMIADSGERATASITIPEGYECKDIFTILEQNGVCTVRELETASATYDFGYDFLDEIPYGDRYRLEGYLFPDTYEFFLGDKPETVLDKFLHNFDNKLDDELLAQIDVLNASLHEKMLDNGFTEQEANAKKLTLRSVITVASLVEKETAKTSESASIASVIYNRLCSRLYPCLQIDATIQYALPERKAELSNADKSVISPYNTYTNPGLPIGPIANPGINSIRAALYPADTDYYFYALGNDGVHKFSKTNYEHQDFVDQVNAERKQETEN